MSQSMLEAKSSKAAPGRDSNDGVALTGVVRVLGGKPVLDGIDVRVPACGRLGIVAPVPRRRARRRDPGRGIQPELDHRIGEPQPHGPDGRVDAGRPSDRNDRAQCRWVERVGTDPVECEISGAERSELARAPRRAHRQMCVQSIERAEDQRGPDAPLDGSQLEPAFGQGPIEAEQAFQFIQEFTGFFTPGITVIFLLGLFWKRTSEAGAIAAAIASADTSARLSV